MQIECSTEQTLLGAFGPRTEFWKRMPIEKIPFLDELRTIVLQHSAQRCPKWKFRFADDLVMQIQPRPTESEIFYCVAVQGTDIPEAIFKLNSTEVRNLENIALLEFTVLAVLSPLPPWRFTPSRLRFRPIRPRDDDRYQAGIQFKHRVLSALQQPDSFDAVKMFQPSCLICSKRLTDPISMARWIGPECATKCSFDARNRNLTAHAEEDQAA